MKRNKKFVIDSIKMDLYRIITATGDIRKEIPRESVKTFLEHADKDFDKIELSPREKELRNRIKTLKNSFSNLEDPKTRLRWTEDIMTTRSLL